MKKMVKYALVASLLVVIGNEAQAQIYNGANTLSNNSSSTGISNTGSGSYSFSTGLSNNLTGSYSAAFGRNNTVTGSYGIAMGYNNTVPGYYAIAMGYGNTAGSYATAFGYASSASGTFSFAAVRGQASGLGSVSLGYMATSTANYSTALGSYPTASGVNSLAIGNYVKATNSKSFAIGNGVNNSTGALENNMSNTLMIGFNSDVPTIFVGASNGIGTTGNVGIGTTKISNYKLSVEGSIRARLIEVNALTWADFVFADDYQLAPLEEVEEYILENNHLPDVPSEAEVLEEGINLGEMDAILLRKIEELTLYMIQLNEKMELLEKENASLKAVK